MIYITGDCHGDYRRFNTKKFPQQKNMNKDDYVIIAGDFGLWDTSREQSYWLDWLEEKPFITLWIDGNHENYDLLSAYPVTMWQGGKIQKIRPSIFHLMRGQIYCIDQHTFFTFGGGASHDIRDGILELDDPFYQEKRKQYQRLHKQYRIHHISWWKEEMPSKEEYEEGMENLKKHNFQVDYIITHCAPTTIQKQIDASYETNALTDYLETIHDQCDYQNWFFGHYHKEAVITKKDILLYEKILSL